jgi:hypothetical protein
MKRHGYPGGRMAHYRRGEKPCDPCRLAENASRGGNHGNWYALAQHALHGTPVCDECLYLACWTEHQRALRYLNRLWETAA